MEVISNNCSYLTMEWASSLGNEFFILGGWQVKLNKHIIQRRDAIERKSSTLGHKLHKMISNVSSRLSLIFWFQ